MVGKKHTHTRTPGTQKARSARAGFTLIELMIVIVIVGVLAATASYGYQKFLRKSKSTEVRGNLNTIAKNVLLYYSVQSYDKQGNPLPKEFPLLPYTPPANPCSTGSARYKKGIGIWKQQGWDKISFSISSSHYYQYKVDTSGKGANAKFTIVARGDLDCDSIYSIYKVRGKINNQTGSPVVEGTVTLNELE